MRDHVCPWWLGPILCCPLRRIIEKPEVLVGPYVKEGMTVLEPGCGMGYFTLPLARMVGESGRVICVDMQPQMIRGLERRARKAGLIDRIVTTVCTSEDLGIATWNGRIDLAVAIHMIHEVPDQKRLLAQILTALKPGNDLVVVEPRGHVSADAFAATLETAAQTGFAVTERQQVRREWQAVLRRPA